MGIAKLDELSKGCKMRITMYSNGFIINYEKFRYLKKEDTGEELPENIKFWEEVKSK